MAELATQEVKLFGKWSFDDVEVRLARALDGKGGVATREVRVADENRAATTFLNLNGVARRAVQRGPRRARRRCAPDF